MPAAARSCACVISTFGNHKEGLTYSDAKVANRNARESSARGDRKWPLNDGQIPNVRGVRVHVSTGYNRVEGIRLASRNGLVGDLPPEIPLHYDFATWVIGVRGRTHLAAAVAVRPPPTAATTRNLFHRRAMAAASAATRRPRPGPCWWRAHGPWTRGRQG
jgi:hypothetical protein